MSPDRLRRKADFEHVQETARCAAVRTCCRQGRPAAGRMGPVKVIVLSDTHAPRRWRSCPPAVAKQLRGAALILHAGDVCTARVLVELAAYAPVRAVRGNNDGPDVAAWGAPDTLELDLGGLRAAMIHDSGPAAGRPARMRR